MNTTNQLVAILDIGTSEVICLVGRQGRYKKIDILGYGVAESKGVRRGVIFNVKEVVESVKEAVAQAEDCVGGKIKKVYAGINGQRLRTVRKSGYRRQDYVEEFTEQHIHYLVREVKSTSCSTDEKVYHVVPQTFTIDEETGIRNPEGIKGKNITGYFNVIVGPQQYWDNLADVMNKAGLELVREIAVPSILGDAALLKDETDTGVAIFDLGGGTSTMAIYTDEYLAHSATIPFGGEVITKDIREGCGIPRDTAEKLKKKQGTAFDQMETVNTRIVLPRVGEFEEKEISSEMLTNIIQARAEEILEALAYQFEESQDGTPTTIDQGVGIVLVGGGANIKHIKELTEFLFGREVRIGTPQIIADNNKFEDKLNDPRFTTACGILQKGIQFNRKNGGKNFVSFEGESHKESKEGSSSWFRTTINKGRTFFENLESHTEDIK